MSRFELVIGTSIFWILMCFMGNICIDVAYRMKVLTPVLPRDNVAASILGCVLTFSGVGSVIVGLMVASGKARRSLAALGQISLRAMLPSYFIFAFVPFANGMALLLLSEETLWGIGLACLGGLASIVFLGLGIQGVSQFKRPE